MLSAKKRFTAMLTAAASITGLAIVAAPSASATTTTASSAAAYGCSGTEIDSYAVKTSGGTTFGTIHLYYDSSTGRNCAVNVANAAGGYGTYTIKNVYLGVYGGTTVYDPAFGSTTKYANYAGPVSVSAPGKCILVGGVIQSPAGTIASYSSEATHCG